MQVLWRFMTEFLLRTYCISGLFCDGTRRYDVPAPFFPSRQKIICNVYY